MSKKPNYLPEIQVLVIWKFGRRSNYNTYTPNNHNSFLAWLFWNKKSRCWHDPQVLLLLAVAWSLLLMKISYWNLEYTYVHYKNQIATYVIKGDNS